MIEAPRHPNYLGIDWGKRDIGLALAHAETRIALPLITIENDRGLVERLGEIIEQEGIGTVIIGIPPHVKREAGPFPVETLGKLLGERLKVTVFYADEMFTTKLAQKLLIERGETAVGEQDDAEAAGIILQEWLDHAATRTAGRDNMVQ